MRSLTILLFSLFPLLIFGQDYTKNLPELLTVTDDVIEIKQSNYNWWLLKSGWRSLYQYENGKLLRQINHYRGELRMDDFYEYTESDKNYIIRHSYTKKEGYSITINQFDNQSRLLKSDLYFDQDTLNPQSTYHSFSFDSLNRIVSYKRTSSNFDYESYTDCYEIKYEQNRPSSKIILDSCTRVTQKRTIQYKSKRSALYVHDWMNPDAIITGGRSENGVARYLYKFDKRGNWTKRFYVKSNGIRILDIKRKIKYEAQDVEPIKI